jgi:hypothetical protein
MSTHSSAGVQEAIRVVVVAPATAETGKGAASQNVANAPTTNYGYSSGPAKPAGSGGP